MGQYSPGRLIRIERSLCVFAISNIHFQFHVRWLPLGISEVCVAFAKRLRIWVASVRLALARFSTISVFVSWVLKFYSFSFYFRHSTHYACAANEWGRTLCFVFHERNCLDKIEHRMLHIITIFVLNGETLPSNRPNKTCSFFSIRSFSAFSVGLVCRNHFQLYFTHVANWILNFKHLALCSPHFTLPYYIIFFFGEMKFPRAA